MISQTDQATFYTGFFKETQLSAWEGLTVASDSHQRLKSYPRLPRHHLPAPIIPSEYSLKDALMQRRSAQELTPAVFSLSDISVLLTAVGVRPELISPHSKGRTYPSAGARYPSETYLIALNCESLPPGLYHYASREHELEELWAKDLRDSLVAATNELRMFSASVVLIFSLVYGRVAEKYGNRGLRYCLIEIGHMAQNVSLMASLLNKNCCEIGGFIDSEVNTWLDVDVESETAVLLMMLGG